MIDMENALIQRHLSELRAIEVARGRVAEGKVDECLDCGGEVGLKRLLVNPVAVRCIDCQGMVEKTYAHEATPRMYAGAAMPASMRSFV